MKTNLLEMKKVFYAIAISASIFTGCSSDDDDPIVRTPVEGEISGDITSNKTFAYGNYTLKGMVKIAAGATVTFEKGSTISADKSNGEDGVIVMKNGKIIANGTAEEPIVFTEKSKIAGSWAGIIIYGDAPIVPSATATTAVSEDGTNTTYGGVDPNHSSGSLRFVRVEHAGQVITQQTKEHNGFSFYAVGAGTVLENLVSYNGNDDGFEFYGGTVSGKNLISYANKDDSFDWQDGWRGQNNTNWYAYQTGTANYGLEVEAKSVNNEFWPKVTNITLKRAAGTQTEATSEIQIDAFQFKKHGNGDFSNIVIDGFVDRPGSGNVPNTLGGVVQVLDLPTYTSQIVGGKIKLTNIKVTNSTNLFITGAAGFTVVAASFPGTNWGPTTTATGAGIVGGKWATVDGINLLANL